MLDESVGKLAGKRLAEEGDVRFHDTGEGNVIRAIVFVVVEVVEVAARFLGRGAVARSLALERSRASSPESRDALAASRDLARLDVAEDGVPTDSVAAALAGGGGKGAVTLHELLGQNAGVGLDVVDVLRVVGEEPALVL